MQQSNESYLDPNSKADKFLKLKLGAEIFGPHPEELAILTKVYREQIINSKVKVVTVGGTNGKGECGYSLYWMLKETGHKVAFWSSPHVISVRERFLFKDGLVGESELLESFLKEYDSKLAKKLSYYEFLFVNFLKLCSHEDLDFIILEVGLGGRLDAVNILDADLALITSISRDHENILGKGFKNILMEKLGITRARKTLISGLELKYCQNIVKNYCDSQQTKYIDLFDLGKITEKDSFSVRNRSLASFAYSWLIDSSKQFDLTAIPSAPGRETDLMLGKLKIKFVGAHNLDGFRKLVSANAEECCPDLALVSFSVRSDKEVKNCLQVLCKSGQFKEVILTKFNHPKAMDLMAWEGNARKAQNAQDANANYQFNQDWEKILSSRLQKSKSVLVCGSYYFISEVKKFISNHC
jgi:dihydrofolate synthase/folylpolyglutamate synthase